MWIFCKRAMQNDVRFVATGYDNHMLQDEGLMIHVSYLKVMLTYDDGVSNANDSE